MLGYVGTSTVRRMSSVSSDVSLLVRTSSLRWSISLCSVTLIVGFLAHHMSNIRVLYPLFDGLIILHHVITSLLSHMFQCRRCFASVSHFSQTHPRDTVRDVDIVDLCDVSGGMNYYLLLPSCCIS